MMNKGLEALAALASADSSSISGGTANLSNNGMNESQRSKGIVPSASVGSLGGTANDQSGNRSTVSVTADANTARTPMATGPQPVSGGGISVNNQQRWQQALASLNPASLSGQNLSIFGGVRQLPQTTDVSALLAMQQQMNYLNYLVQAQAAKQNSSAHTPLQPSPTPPAGNLGVFADATQVLQLALSGHSSPSLASRDDTPSRTPSVQILPSGTAGSSNPQPTTATGSNTTSSSAGSSVVMPPPKSSSAQQICLGTPSISSSHEPTAIAPQPSIMASGLYDEGSTTHPFEARIEDKKQHKRAANRKSAQLSRKRKKQFIEELKDENDDLRRKEQILRSIPDMIVVFDSSGKLWFVSESVDRFLDFTVRELEGTSFWDRLCDDSVRLLKAAFMDSLAARQQDSDTVPLGSGVWKIKLIDKDGTQKLVALNGVVHFAGERPECVCTIRPQEDSHSKLPTAKSAQERMTEPKDTQQPSERQRSASKHGEAVRISDSGNSSVGSDSGSSDEMTEMAS